MCYKYVPTTDVPNKQKKKNVVTFRWRAIASQKKVHFVHPNKLITKLSQCSKRCMYVLSAWRRVFYRILCDVPTQHSSLSSTNAKTNIVQYIRFYFFVVVVEWATANDCRLPTRTLSNITVDEVGNFIFVCLFLLYFFFLYILSRWQNVMAASGFEYYIDFFLNKENLINKWSMEFVCSFCSWFGQFRVLSFCVSMYFVH